MLPTLTQAERAAVLVVLRADRDFLARDPDDVCGGLAWMAHTEPDTYRLFSQAIRREGWGKLTDAEIIELLENQQTGAMAA